MRRSDARHNCDENERDASIEDDESAHPFRARKSIFLRPFVCERRSAHVSFTACGEIETCSYSELSEVGTTRSLFETEPPDQNALLMIEPLFESGKLSWTSFKRFIVSKIR